MPLSSRAARSVQAVVFSLCLAAAAGAAAANKAELRALLSAERFAQLDAQLSSHQERYRNGEIDDEQAFEPFVALTVIDSDLRGSYDRWIVQYPHSYAARLARGYYLSGLGWAARGLDFASQTTQHRFTDMRGYFQEAMADLQASLALDTKPVLSWSAMIRVARGDPRFGDIGSYLAQATALDANVYTARMSYLLGIRPEWGGSVEAMERFVADARPFLSSGQATKLGRVLDDSRARVELAAAESLYNAGAYSAAIEQYSAALAKRPTGRGFAWRAWAYLRANQPQKAIADFGRSLDIDPDEHCGCNAYSGRAEAWLALGARDKALPDLIHAAEVQDNHWAARQLAGMYAYGWHGMNPDPQRARPWCERAAKQGDPWSMHCIAHAYRTGWGGAKRDPAKGLHWMQRAADRGIPGAQYDLGWVYWIGEDVPKDDLKAIQWWWRAASQGDTQAQGRLLELAAVPLFVLVGAFLAVGTFILVWRRRQSRKV